MNLKKLAAAAAVSTFAFSPVALASTDTVTQNLSVVVSDTITITQDTPMAFDTIAVNGAEQTINSSTPAAYTVTGADGGQYTIDTSATAASLVDGAGNSMAFSVTASKVSGTIDQDDGTGTGTLQDEFTVSGSLVVGAQQVGGTYTGDLVVTVAYAGGDEGGETGFPTFP